MRVRTALTLHPSTTSRSKLYARCLPALRPVDVEGIGGVWVREGTSDHAVLDQIFYTEEFNISTAPQFAWIRAAYDGMLAAGETPFIVDCGANIGLSALYFASHLPKAKIVGIEPARDNVELARRNTAPNPLIEIIEAGVHDTRLRSRSSILGQKSSPIRS